jgi:NTP pyrophosphatase (non-canonical NTP hydrolase)
MSNPAQDVMAAIIDETSRAITNYEMPTSTHESLGVLLEEFEELREAIHRNDRDAIMKEAIQVASVAYRLAWTCHSPSVAFSKRSGLE